LGDEYKSWSSSWWSFLHSPVTPSLLGTILQLFSQKPRRPKSSYFNPFQSYVRPRPTLWFSCSRCFSWSLTLSNPIFLPPTYPPALIYFGR
jgi:hypothetical protein